MLRKWHLKAIIQKAISFVPVYSHRINFLFQKHVTKGVQLTDEYFEIKVRHLCENFLYLQKLAGNQSNHRLLEIGTGWYPITPVGMYLLGLKHVFTYDISPLTGRENILAVIKIFLDKYSELEEKYCVEFDRDRLKKIESVYKDRKNFDLDGLLSELSITLLVGHGGLDDLSNIDCIVSNNTLEHISEQELHTVFQTFSNCLNEDGIMSHFIDMTDHFAHMDKTITVYNFLQFSSFWWGMIDNSIQPMNRLRLSDHLAIHKATNFEILDVIKWPYDIGLLNSQDIHPEILTKYTKEDIAVVHAYVLSRKA